VIISKVRRTKREKTLAKKLLITKNIQNKSYHKAMRRSLFNVKKTTKTNEAAMTTFLQQNFDHKYIIVKTSLQIFKQINE